MTGKQDSNVAQMNQLSYQLEEMVKIRIKSRLFTVSSEIH